MNTNTVATRIKQAPGCKLIELTEAEQTIHNGTGWRLAHFIDGQLTELYTPIKSYYVSITSREILDKITAWFSTKEGEVWLVKCSCYDLCKPCRVTNDDNALFHVTRTFFNFLDR